MKTQKKDQKSGTAATSAKKTIKSVSTEDMKKVKGGSGLLSGGNDLTNVIQGMGTISNSSSGSDGDRSYTSQDSHSADLGLGNSLSNINF